MALEGNLLFESKEGRVIAEDGSYKIYSSSKPTHCLTMPKTDFETQYVRNGDSFYAYCQELGYGDIAREAFKAMKKDCGFVSIEEVKEVVEKNFPRAWPMTEAALATIVQLALEDQSACAALTFQGPPSSLKTTVLSFFY